MKRFQLKKLYKCTFTPAEASYMIGWMIGNHFGDIRVVAYLENESKQKHHYIVGCVCMRCGKYFTMPAYTIIYQNKTSCGDCAHKEWSESKVENLVGKKFGTLTVLKRIYGRKKTTNERSSRWLCRCDCGEITECSRQRLVYHENPTCPRCVKKKVADKRIQDLTGKRFGKLVVLECIPEVYQLTGRRKNRASHWLCQCDCGNQKVVSSGELRSGATQTCGCGRAVSSLWERRIIGAVSVAFPQFTVRGYQNNGTQLRLYYSEHKIKNKRHYFSYDGAISDPNLKVVIECNGRRYHPKSPDEINSKGEPWTNPWGKDAKERYAHDQKKLDLALSRGYNVIVVWDSDKESDCIDFIINHIKMIMEDKNEVPRLFVM